MNENVFENIHNTRSHKDQLYLLLQEVTLLKIPFALPLLSKSLFHLIVLQFVVFTIIFSSTSMVYFLRDAELLSTFSKKLCASANDINSFKLKTNKKIANDVIEKSIIAALLLQAIHLMKQKNKYRIPEGIIIKKSPTHTMWGAKKRSDFLVLIDIQQRER